jgi:hypothetical protein
MLCFFTSFVFFGNLLHILSNWCFIVAIVILFHFFINTYDFYYILLYVSVKFMIYDYIF